MNRIDVWLKYHGESLFIFLNCTLTIKNGLFRKKNNFQNRELQDFRNVQVTSDRIRDNIKKASLLCRSISSTGKFSRVMLFRVFFYIQISSLIPFD